MTEHFPNWRNCRRAAFNGPFYPAYIIILHYYTYILLLLSIDRWFVRDEDNKAIIFASNNRAGRRLSSPALFGDHLLSSHRIVIGYPLQTPTQTILPNGNAPAAEFCAPRGPSARLMTIFPMTPSKRRPISLWCFRWTGSSHHQSRLSARLCSVTTQTLALYPYRI